MHKFMCLAYLDQQVPLQEGEKDELYVAGLGEKEIKLDLDINAEEFCSSIFEVYVSRCLKPLTGLAFYDAKLKVGTAQTYCTPGHCSKFLHNC